MKKLYFLNEEEKQRILNIHESATIRQYLREQNTNSSVVTKAYNEIYSGFAAMGTNANKIINGLKTLTTPNEFWELNQMFATKKPEGFNSFQDMINSEFEYTKYQTNTNSNDVNEIRKKLKELGISSSITKTDDGTIYKKGSFKIISQPNSGSSKKLPPQQGQQKQQYRQQIIAKTEENTRAIQRLLGLTETGVMDSVLLQKINDKLNGKPQESPKSDVATQPRPQVEPLQTSLKPAGVVQQQLSIPSPEQLTAGLQQQQQKAADAAKTPPTNKEKRQERRDLRAANKAEMQALRDKQRGNQ